MHKTFYASGFLYNLKTQQILLLQSQPKDDTTKPLWSMLGGEGGEGEEAQSAFQRIVSKLLNLNLKAKNIHPIYDYFHETEGKENFVFYAEVKKSPIFNSIEENTLSWVSFSETLKLLFTNHTKQDVIVGERVINLKRRIDSNQQFSSPAPL